MRLTRVEIHGFKSFSDRTQLDFSEGLTAVVGPNGCGKSNIIDAIKWALGEQRPGALRGDEMLDVIFKGNGARPARNFAEVSLVFDNADGTLPVEYSEVVVTRRLFRSGESEYLINRQATRLKDIRNLFLDTGLGAGAYSIMEQGRIDAILSANPHERRRIFEEAAGISRYRARRRESESKLDRTEQNLLRLGDVVEELEKQQRSLKYQAGRARSFEQAKARLSELKSLDYAHRWHAWGAEAETLAADVSAGEAAEAAVRGQLEAARNEATALQSRLSELRGDVDAASEAFRKATAAVDALAERQAATRERLEELASRRELLEGRLAALERVLEERQREMAAVNQRLADVQTEREAAEAAVAEKGQAARAVRVELEAWQRELESRRETALGRLAELTECRNVRAEADSERAALAAGRQKLSERLEHLTAELEEHRRVQGELFAGVRDLEASLEQARLVVQQRQTTRGEAAGRHQEIEAALRGAREELAGLQSRHEALLELVERHEGVAPGARLLLESGQAGIEGLLADELRVPREWAFAVEAALGASAQALVVAGREQAEQARRWLSEQGGGRVRLLPRDGLRARQGAAEGRALLDHIEVAQPTEAVARALLGHVRLVDDLADCRPDGVTVWVTAAGDLLDEEGVLHTGRGGDEGGLVARRAECDALAAESVKVAETVTTLERELKECEGAVVALDSQLAAAEKDARRVETERERTRERERHAAERQTLLERDSRIVEEELSRLQAELVAVGQRHEQAARREAELQAAVSEDQAAEDRHDRAREELDDRVSEAQAVLSGARTRLSTLTERRESLETERRQLSRAAQERGEEVQRTRHEYDDLRKRGEALQQELSAAEERGRVLAEERDQCAGVLDEARSATEGFNERLKSSQELVQQHETRVQDAAETLAAARMKHQEVAIRRQGLRDKVIEELEIDFDRSPPALVDEGQDWEAVAKEIEDLRQRMARMGNVNLGAIEELEEVEERLGFLTTQRDDLLAAKKSLVDTIARVNKESRERFVASFEEIREHFKVVFRKLFQGGRADVFLEEGEDVLDAGIEIVAAPPGKDQRSISLLSGGERTLTAVGLLFALFRSRPSPVCLLDEVDAALDETNIDRFCSVLEDFLGKSQFLVVTHARRTMSYADTIYGVTMQEHGVSKVLSLTMAEYDRSQNGDGEQDGSGSDEQPGREPKASKGASRVSAPRARPTDPKGASDRGVEVEQAV